MTIDELKDFFAGQGNHEWDDQVWEALLREVDENSDGQVILIFLRNEINLWINRSHIQNLRIWCSRCYK